MRIAAEAIAISITLLEAEGRKAVWMYGDSHNYCFPASSNSTFFEGKTRITCKNRTGTKKDLFVFYGFLCFLFFLFLVYGRISSFYVFIGGGGPP
jgi:hypothetical protein